jgi:hypothetical protein
MSLPPELLAIIFRAKGDSASLRTCSLVCRAWRITLQSVLFHQSRLSLRRVPWNNPVTMHELAVILPTLKHLVASHFSWNEDTTATEATCFKRAAAFTFSDEMYPSGRPYLFMSPRWTSSTS